MFLDLIVVKNKESFTKGSISLKPFEQIWLEFYLKKSHIEGNEEKYHNIDFIYKYQLFIELFIS